MAIIVRAVFHEDNKYYPHDFLDECLYKLPMLCYDKIDISEGIDVNKRNVSKKYAVCHHWYFLGFKFQL